MAMAREGICLFPSLIYPMTASPRLFSLARYERHDSVIRLTPMSSAPSIL